MRLHELHVQGYRSIRDIRLRLDQINVIVGPNGCGKSNLYRSLFLLAGAARGELARTLAAEGGMPSALWAGERKKGAVRMTLGVKLDEWQYELSCGLPIPAVDCLFLLDPVVKTERLCLQKGRNSKATFLERENVVATLRDDAGLRSTYPAVLSSSESVLAQIQEMRAYPELAMMQRELLGWRFYHQFRTDMDSPLRQPQVIVRTPVLSHDGRDLAAALRTTIEQGRREEVTHELDKAFPGSELEFLGDHNARYTIGMRMPGIRRPFDAAELSDGTLRYLCLLAALLTTRPPTLIALNEPETSIHPDLLEPLAHLVTSASRHSQIWITTHSRFLADAIREHSAQKPVELEMCQGETRVVGQGLLDK